MSTDADNQVSYVTREQYDRLLGDYNKLKEKYESSGRNSPETADQPTQLQACMGRMQRFEYLMKELQDDFRDMKASIRPRPSSSSGSRETFSRRTLPDEDNPIQYVMTIVHPKHNAKQSMP